MIVTVVFAVDKQILDDNPYRWNRLCSASSTNICEIKQNHQNCWRKQNDWLQERDTWIPPCQCHYALHRRSFTEDETVDLPFVLRQGLAALERYISRRFIADYLLRARVFSIFQLFFTMYVQPLSPTLFPSRSLSKYSAANWWDGSTGSWTNTSAPSLPHRTILCHSSPTYWQNLKVFPSRLG